MIPNASFLSSHIMSIISIISLPIRLGIVSLTHFPVIFKILLIVLKDRLHLGCGLRHGTIWLPACHALTFPGSNNSSGFHCRMMLLTSIVFHLAPVFWSVPKESCFNAKWAGSRQDEIPLEKSHRLFPWFREGRYVCAYVASNILSQQVENVTPRTTWSGFYANFVKIDLGHGC